MKIVIDLDNTITIESSKPYGEKEPRLDVIMALREYKKNGFYIVIFSSRNMRTYDGSIGKINCNTLPVILEWLNENEVPFDEVIVGKPWCGNHGFYVDDRAIRPDEFARLSYDEICSLLNMDGPEL